MKLEQKILEELEGRSGFSLSNVKSIVRTATYEKCNNEINYFRIQGVSISNYVTYEPSAVYLEFYTENPNQNPKAKFVYYRLPFGGSGEYGALGEGVRGEGGYYFDYHYRRKSKVEEKPKGNIIEIGE